MEYPVQNNSLLYSAPFIREIARIWVRDLSSGLYESVITLPITVWQIIEHQRQQFDTYHQGQVPITVNQRWDIKLLLLVAITILMLMDLIFPPIT